MIVSSHSWLVHGLTCELGTINNFSIDRGKKKLYKGFYAFELPHAWTQCSEANLSKNTKF